MRFPGRKTSHFSETWVYEQFLAIVLCCGVCTDADSDIKARAFLLLLNQAFMDWTSETVFFLCSDPPDLNFVTAFVQIS